MHGSLQKRLIEEIDAFGRDWTPDYDTLESELQYLDAVVKESLRLYPPAHFLIREVEKSQKYGGKPRQCNIYCNKSSLQLQNHGH